MNINDVVGFNVFSLILCYCVCMKIIGVVHFRILINWIILHNMI